MFYFSLTQKVAEGEDRVLSKVKDERFPVQRTKFFPVKKQNKTYTLI